MPNARSRHLAPRVLSLALLGLLLAAGTSRSQQLDVETIMQDPDGWLGSPPSGLTWSEDGRWLYFRWNPDREEFASIYRVPSAGGEPEEVSLEELDRLPGSLRSTRNGPYLDLSGTWDQARRRRLYIRDGDIWLWDARRGEKRRLTFTRDSESSPRWSRDESEVIFSSGGDWFALTLETGGVRQIIHFQQASGQAGGEKKTALQEWVAQQELELIKYLAGQKAERERYREWRESFPDPEEPMTVEIPRGRRTSGSSVTADGRFVVFRVRIPGPEGKNTIVPDYVRESGYTEEIRARTKVGEPLDRYELGIADTRRDTTYYVDFSLLSDRVSDPLGPPHRGGEWAKGERDRIPITPSLPEFNEDDRRTLLEVNSQDNKDRFVLGLDLETGAVHMADHQHDEAWIGGPIRGLGWMPDGERFWYLSEKTGFAHLYVKAWDGTGERALTSGSFEVYGPRMDREEERWFFQANDVHPGVRHFYSMPLEGGEWTRYTTGEGRFDATLSPDERTMAVLHSTTDHPAELYLKRLRPSDEMIKVTETPREAWSSLGWTAPPVITFTARDGAEVYARLYKPEDWRPGGPAVIFVHGAGYLQNAHTWWSSYFREYMFHHLLMERGYMVLDMDYRGSAGYGRDWRTAIYRHMGDKDLTDQADGARWLVSEHGVDAGRIGIYGGSYGGFITLMGMFTTPEVFAAGAALRPVTDWAHYNHGYTSNILNVPQADSLAYVRSSPIYHAGGLEGALLICHGLVDTNVHAQDSIRLAQRLIELRKEGWELALYPVENHGFTEPTSWMDEYKRILRLFEEHLK
ncbi:MAG: prolyl oligopeptidase family serine peptidase [bacterium]